MKPRKRITAALVGLILLVVLGWFVRQLGDDGSGWSLSDREVVVDLGG